MVFEGNTLACYVAENITFMPAMAESSACTVVIQIALTYRFGARMHQNSKISKFISADFTSGLC